MTEQVDTVIVGAGHAGLTVSYFLSQLGQHHLILERGQIGERWHSERWDSFCFQFPNWTMELPGFKYQCDDLNAFASGREVVRFIQEYATVIDAPVRTGVTVKVLERATGTGHYQLQTTSGVIEASNVVIATGSRHEGSLPALNSDIPSDIYQVHSSAYRNSNELPLGSVLVVGSGASGYQIAEELHHDGRQVYLCVGRHRRLPRRYRGHDYLWWNVELGLYDRRRIDLPPAANQAAAVPPGPLLTGVDGGHDVDFRKMAANGMVLLGRLAGVRGRTLMIAPDLAEKLDAGDTWFNSFKQAVDAHVKETGMDVPAESPSPAPRNPAEAQHPIRELDLDSAGIQSIVWATGHRFNYDWVHLPVFNDRHEPVHDRGVAELPGIYFLGLRWLYRLRSSFLALSGPGEDAEYLAARIAARTGC